MDKEIFIGDQLAREEIQLGKSASLGDLERLKFLNSMRPSDLSIFVGNLLGARISLITIAAMEAYRENLARENRDQFYRIPSGRVMDFRRLATEKVFKNN